MGAVMAWPSRVPSSPSSGGSPKSRGKARDPQPGEVHGFCRDEALTLWVKRNVVVVDVVVDVAVAVAVAVAE
jgi:hypothetical protein